MLQRTANSERTLRYHHHSYEWWEGYNGYGAFVKRTECPYEDLGRHESWLHGWDQAAEDD